MKISSLFTLAIASAYTAEGLRIPSDIQSISERNAAELPRKRDISSWSDLWKRKGGGGGGKGGGGSSSSGSSSEGSSSGSSSGSSGARTPNAGGATSAGSGAPRTAAGGRYYGGGATTPYTAGRRTPSGLAPAGLLGVGALAFFPGLWLYGAYSYPYSHPYGFYNQTAKMNQTRAVDCLCQEYSVCGCDDNTDTSYLNGLVGNGSTADMNQTLVRVANVNGTDTIFINGTLPNGTTAPGGSSSGGVHVKAVETIGWSVIGGAVAFAMWII